MTAAELQRLVKAALENLSVPVTKDFSEFNGTYPHIVYREISNVPVLHCDNGEYLFKAVYQVAIVTSDDNYEELERAVERAMSTIGFARTDAQDIFDGDFSRVLRFSIIRRKT